MFDFYKKYAGGAKWEIIKFIAIVAFIVIPIRVYVAQPFIIKGTSMYPTFENADYLIIDEFSYNFLRTPERGEVIVFKFPEDTSKFFIKRVIGLPGETVVIKEGRVLIYDKEEGNPKALDESYIGEEFTLPDGVWALGLDEYFVMGDNRRFSSDSRSWGSLPEDLIVGRALARLWPINEIDYLPGAASNK
ncbi:MAG: signal peptidase I [Candidatus Niyogibacteria bacterium CG10_big_fil_rev_8_21_14_0_10_42_19]|uniref:Signal peptidase I n=1 Tax=Candidatus Niyogibacteria bacterium CG10_big_fil_rev_8_21_14_0_10_42_19 TaxID=1974725 RepID=A0A2H0TG68_9BACT|nr:MAG: signal peptidase I [Candidatus Niyogibacteria bacterium CG10_big_fil_rev_8_21_14_0_10_42_19]